MEAYKTTCPDCGNVRYWTGYKTGIGKTEEQLERMRRDHTTCRACGSTNATTDLDHETEMGQVMDAQTNLLAQVLGEVLAGKVKGK